MDIGAIFSIVILILSVIVHEVAHGSGAVIGWAKPVPYNPYNLKNQKWGTLAVAIAGVSANFLMALIFGLIIRFVPDLPQSFVDISKMIIYINIFLGVFNILPIPPFDGSKILLALVP